MRVEAILMTIFANISRPLAKFPMTSPSIHGGARSAPPCNQAVLMGDFARGREIFASVAIRMASIRTGSTQYKDRLVIVTEEDGEDEDLTIRAAMLRSSLGPVFTSASAAIV